MDLCVCVCALVPLWQKKSGSPSWKPVERRYYIMQITISCPVCVYVELYDGVYERDRVEINSLKGAVDLLQSWVQMDVIWMCTCLVKKSDCSNVGSILSVSCTRTGMGGSGMLAGVWFYAPLMSKTYSKNNVIARSAGPWGAFVFSLSPWLYGLKCWGKVFAISLNFCLEHKLVHNDAQHVNNKPLPGKCLFLTSHYKARKCIIFCALMCLFHLLHDHLCVFEWIKNCSPPVAHLQQEAPPRGADLARVGW